MKKFTKVNKDICISCGACEMAAPDIFDYDENDLAYSMIDDNKGITPVPEEWVDDLIEAHEGCPTEAICVSDQPFENAPVEGKGQSGKDIKSKL
ncbi:ferredoxin [Terrilactibacillus laevilacticus]|uniref:Ferredoxin n=1 Tax=Terrilactibacillus laevilacticus TaxID=1380157 RepID=A0ABW5PRP3_9BACI|nr:ferredoxin [Terrilactibacillus laevilacticus]